MAKYKTLFFVILATNLFLLIGCSDRPNEIRGAVAILREVEGIVITTNYDFDGHPERQNQVSTSSQNRNDSDQVIVLGLSDKLPNSRRFKHSFSKLGDVDTVAFEITSEESYLHYISLIQRVQNVARLVISFGPHFAERHFDYSALNLVSGVRTLTLVRLPNVNGMSPLQHLPTIENLAVANSHLDDAWLIETVVNNPQITRLSLINSPVADSTLQILKGDGLEIHVDVFEELSD